MVSPLQVKLQWKADFLQPFVTGSSSGWGLHRQAAVAILRKAVVLQLMVLSAHAGLCSCSPAVVSYGCLQLLVSLGAYPCVLLGLGSSSTDTDVHFSLQQKCDRLLSSLLHLLNVTVKWRAYRKRRKKPLFLSKSLLLLFASAHNYPVLKICTVLFCKVLCALQILLVSAVDQQFTDLEHLWDNS